MTARTQPVADRDLRARLYLLLGNLLVAPPDRRLLALTAQLDGGESALGTSIRELAEAARCENPESLAAEYDALFIGVARGELVPYASYYLTGFMNERPLARLRDDMRSFGIARSEEVREPEDHIAAICEMMSGLLSGVFGCESGDAEQRRFFGAHLAPWAPRFFRDLERAEAARFYKAVGRFGQALLEFEAAYLETGA